MKKIIWLVFLLCGCVSIGCTNKRILIENNDLKTANAKLEKELAAERGKNKTMRKWWSTHLNNLKEADKTAEGK